jgi:hypothetical protein
MQESETIILSVALEPRDLNHPWLWSARNIFRWFVILLGCFLLFQVFTMARSEGRSVDDTLTIPILAVVAILTGIFLPYLRILWIFKKSPALRRPRRMTFASEGMRMEAEDASGEYKWTLFWQIRETYKCFLLLQTTHSATYIPKRCFSSPEEISRFREILRTNYHGKLKLRRE